MIREYINRTGLVTKLIIGILLTIIVSFTDYYTTKDISFSIFYLIPITFISWNTNKFYGIIFSVLCSVIWFYLDTSGMEIITNLAIHYWSTLVRFGFFIIVTILISKLKLLRDNQDAIIAQRTSELTKEIQEHMKSREDLLQKSKQLRELNKKIESIKEEQNIQIAREIHDELGQSLTAINLEIMWVSKKHSDDSDIVERMYTVSKIVENTIATVRKISSDLRPRLLDQLGILPAIESLLKDFKLRTNIETILSIPEVPLKLNNTESITIYRIFQEALTNISRHSKCTVVEVNIKIENNFLFLLIKDNGIGFNLQSKINETNSIGLLSMQERTDIIQGNIKINSKEGFGTQIFLKVPLNQ